MILPVHVQESTYPKINVSLKRFAGYPVSGYLIDTQEKVRIEVNRIQNLFIVHVSKDKRFSLALYQISG